MRVMVIVKATRTSETGVMPDARLLADMGRYNEQLVKAGVMQDGAGLKPSMFGKRVRFGGGHKSVIDGPFEAGEGLVAGYWIWRVGSMEEALELVKRCPDPMPGETSELEVRPLFEAEDFAS